MPSTNSNSNSHSTFQSFTTSYSSSSVNGQTKSHSETTYSDPSGTRVHRTSQEPGEAVREERFHVDQAGQRIHSGEATHQHRVQDVTDQQGQQARNDAEYEENIQDEYAKREGGA